MDRSNDIAALLGTVALPEELPLELGLLLSLADDIESPASGLLATVVSSLPASTDAEAVEPSLLSLDKLADTEEEPLELSLLVELESLELVLTLILTPVLDDPLLLPPLLLVSDEHAATSGSITCDRSSRPVSGMEQSGVLDGSSCCSNVTHAVTLHTLAACAIEGTLDNDDRHTRADRAGFDFGVGSDRRE